MRTLLARYDEFAVFEVGDESLAEVVGSGYGSVGVNAICPAIPNELCAEANGVCSRAPNETCVNPNGVCGGVSENLTCVTPNAFCQ
jgi:hypothetical protein